MTQVALLVDFIVNMVLQFWAIVTQYWFLIGPMFVGLFVGIVSLIFNGIGPSNANRKH